ncbi:hypothetical protein GCM10007916_30390 [Psychromonas marina]|uniref:SIR2-like domain-containing protein n=1 Tax=Psychromonas marina TaxID=88364 RepID=A0ABQ6E3G1_9GAMM|nr:SIR2 family protein [Psychromonas marina]GLS91969.1 hypothetical protein GCM10007916_30390 [Psychromonas marina]
MDYARLKKELGHKERTVDDLISYIGTKTNEHVPNYSLLLGAGASFTSGIKTGINLVSGWREEVYKHLCPEEEYEGYEEFKAKDFLIKNYSNWYNLSNEYSSLFEYKFDLPSQRRRFVEQEVDGHLPSIGYSYLVSLTTNRFFDTIYTTNFDDLLNEAFYQFSQVRPLVCAHDSSLQSISVNSSRPKIIKLHGDYLFDDIKSTLRETESLENNIKNKFTQFSKEYGLIIIGYAGNDRSVMDVINFLLKSEEYLNNGVYWCLREGDYINPELTKLLWKDKVYFIKISGFDEVMAEMHYKLKRELSLDDNFTNSKKEAIISSFTEDEYRLSEKSEYISSDIKQLTKHKNSMDISHLIRELNEKEFNGSEEDFKTFLSLDRLVQEKNYIEATNIIKSRVDKPENIKSKGVYLKKLILIYKAQDKIQEALSLCDELIELDPFEVRSLIFKSEIFKNMTERCKFIEGFQTKFNSNYQFHNYLLTNAIDEFHYTKTDSVFSLDFLLQTADRSLQLEPSLNNISWLFKLDLLNLKFNDRLDKKVKKEKEKEIENHLEKAKSINDQHMRYLKMSLHSSVINNDYKNIKNIFDILLNIYITSSKGKKRKLLSLICEEYPSLVDHKNNESFYSDWSNFIDSDLIKKIPKNEELASLLINKAQYYLMIEKDEEKSLKFLKLAMMHSDASDYASTIINSFLNLSNNYDEAYTFLNKIKDEIKKRVYYSLKSNILLAESLFDKAEESLDKSYQYGLSHTNYLTKGTFLNLMAQRYTKVISMVDSNIDKIEDQQDQDILTINKELAYKKLHDKLNDKVTARNIISRGLTKHLTLAAHCLLDNEIDIKRLIKQSIDNDYTSLYQFKSWPVIPEKYLSGYLNKKTELKLA